MCNARMRLTTSHIILGRLSALHIRGALSENVRSLTWFLVGVHQRIVLFSTRSIPAIWEESSDEKVSMEALNDKEDNLTTEVALENFFKRGEIIRQIVDLMKLMPWGEELQVALKELHVVFDIKLVTQLLRYEIPCDVVLGFLDWVEEVHGFKHTDYTVNAMLNSLGRAGRVKEMQEKFYALKCDGWAFSSVTLSNVMQWLMHAKDAEGVTQIWKEVDQLSRVRLPAVCTTYIDHLIRVKKYKKVQKLYEAMLKEKIVPCSRLYMVFIQHLVAAGNIEAAAKIMKIMMKLNVMPHRATYELVINGFAKLGNVYAALEHLNEMREYFRKPTMSLLPTLHVLTITGELEAAKKLSQDIWSGSANSDMQDHFEDNESDGAEEDDLLSEWRNVTCLHVGFDINVFSQLLITWNSNVEDILQRAHVNWTSALVLAIMRRLKSLMVLWHFFNWLKDEQQFKHDIFTCGFLLRRILKSRLIPDKKMILVEKLFAGTTADGLELTVPIFNIVISYYVEISQPEKALKVLISLEKEFGLKPNKYSYTHVIRGFAQQCKYEKAMTLLKMMQKEGFEMDSVTCARMITCFGMVKKYEMAHGLFQEALESHGYADAHVYKAIMTNYMRQGNFNMALKIYEEMRENGIHPNQDMHPVVISILRQAQRYTELNELIAERKWLHPKRKKLQDSLVEILHVFLETMIERKALLSVKLGKKKEIDEIPVE